MSQPGSFCERVSRSRSRFLYLLISVCGKVGVVTTSASSESAVSACSLSTEMESVVTSAVVSTEMLPPTNSMVSAICALVLVRVPSLSMSPVAAERPGRLAGSELDPARTVRRRCSTGRVL